MAEFGELLAELRQENNMTQQDLANILFVSVSTISNYEKGVHLPDIIKLAKIADYFHVTTDYLLGRSSSTLSPDVLNQEVIGGKTTSELINDLRAMSSERREALALVINDMSLSNMIGQLSRNAKEVTP